MKNFADFQQQVSTNYPDLYFEILPFSPSLGSSYGAYIKKGEQTICTLSSAIVLSKDEDIRWDVLYQQIEDDYKRLVK